MTELGHIHRFDAPLPLDSAAARRWLGGKGAGLAEMTRMGLPVPPGFTLTTQVWRHWNQHGSLPDGLREAVLAEVARLEERTGLRFGDMRAPLLLAVRSGAPSSMPGMLDTVVDVGVNPEIARGLSQRYGEPLFGLDLRRCFVESYAPVVLGVPREAFDALLGPARAAPHALTLPKLEALLVDYERMLREEGAIVPDDPHAQLFGSIEAVLRSWAGTRATQYRSAHGIAFEEGTGVTVHAMVFGNLDDRSAAGVVFSRNPSTGERGLFGEHLIRSQGEDVVSGRRTPLPLTQAQVRRGTEDVSLERAMPEVVGELGELCARLEARYGDAMDVEFVVERGRLWVVQSRPAKRTARAAARIAVGLVEEGALTREQAILRIEAIGLRSLLTSQLPDPEALAAEGIAPIARGLAASPGAAAGPLVFEAGEGILVRADTSAEDVEAMRRALGVLTSTGGLTSHAAVVARALGKPCVAGASGLHVDYVRRVVVARGARDLELAEGTLVTIDGGRGLVYAGALAAEPAPVTAHAKIVLEWADAIRKARVFVEAQTAVPAGAADGVLATGPEALREGAIGLAAGDAEVQAMRSASPHALVVAPLGVAGAEGVWGPLAGLLEHAGADPIVVAVVEVAAGERLERLDALRAERIVLRGPGALAAIEAAPPLAGLAIAVAAADVPVAKMACARAVARRAYDPAVTTRL